MDLVSIIIPTYNRFEVLLPRALQSVLQQTYKNIEIIITDDNSSKDKAKQNKYINSLKDPRIKYIQNPKNQGFVQNLNVGLSHAKGKYLSILFDDDYLHPNYIASTMSIFKRNQDIAFVQVGAFNDIDNHKTTYHPKTCGKMTKYTYLYYVNHRFHHDIIHWSISPGNYVFRNQGIKFRTNLYEGWYPRQLRRGSGYDALFILDHLTNYQFCYHLPEHLCTFSSHPNSLTILNYDEVVNDTKKGIDQYFYEYPDHIYIEIDRYMHDYILYNIRDDIPELVETMFKILISNNISIYEFHNVFFSHGFYNTTIENIIDKANIDSSIDFVKLLDEYKKIIRNLMITSPDIVPTLSYLRTQTVDEKERYESEEYKQANKVTMNNIVRHYWDDFIERNLKRIALVCNSNHIKYVKMFKKPAKEPRNININFDKLQVLYLHKNVNVELSSEEELYNSAEFRLTNRMPKCLKLIDFSLYQNTLNKAWKLIPIPLLYKDIAVLSNKPENEWLDYIKTIDFEVSIYRHIRSLYMQNIIVGEDLRCATQISGHLRFYKKLAKSLLHLENLVHLDNYLFIWNDGMGFKNQMYEASDIADHIRNAIEVFKPISYKIENNNEFLETSLYFSGIKFIEYNACSYPQLKSQYYSVHQANCLRNESGKEYDIVFKLRMDADLDTCIDPTCLFEIYFTTNFKNFIFTSFEKDHGHTGGTTGCELCNTGYYKFRHPSKHFGEHANDICDFLAICSTKSMDYYCDMYRRFEELYLTYNKESYQKIQYLRGTGKIKDETNTFLPEEYKNLYDRMIISPEMLSEYRIGIDVPLYPEAFLRIYLRDFVVVSNRYFRFLFHWKTAEKEAQPQHQAC
jgi:glycosyltransferase involved in cell wall biosynthesis